MSKSEKFLLSEYELLREFRANQISQSENRFNYYLVLLSAFIVGAGALFGVETIWEMRESLILPIVFCLGIMFILGLFILRRIFGTHIGATRYTRYINRIRQYFITQDDSIEEAIRLPAVEKKDPPYLVVGIDSIFSSGLAGMMMFINSTTLGIAAGLCVYRIHLIENPAWLLWGSVFLYSFFAAYWLQYQWALNLCQKAQKEDGEREMEHKKRMTQKKRKKARATLTAPG